MENKLTPMTNNTQQQLPADIERKINEHFDRHTCSNGTRIDIKKFVAEVIAAYAVKLQHEEKKNDMLEEALAHWNTKATTAVDLLKKFISRHEAGLLPDRFIYEEIKTFLDGK